MVHSIKTNFYHVQQCQTKLTFRALALRQIGERIDLTNRSDEGLTLETSAFEFFTVANLRFQLS